MSPLILSAPKKRQILKVFFAVRKISVVEHDHRNTFIYIETIMMIFTAKISLIKHQLFFVLLTHAIHRK